MKALFCLFISLPVFATNYTASVTGTWDNPITWGGAGIPGNGDTAIVNDGVVVTIPAGYQAIIGTSPSSGGTVALQCATANGTGRWDINGTLTMRGPVKQCQYMNLGPGAILEHDSSLAATPAATNYSYQTATEDQGSYEGRVLIHGTAANHSIIRKAAGSGNGGGFTYGPLCGGRLQGSYVDISDWGTATIPLANINLPQVTGRGPFDLDHATITRSGALQNYTGFGFSYFRLDSSVITAPLHHPVDFQVGGMTGLASITFSNDIIHGQLKLYIGTAPANAVFSNVILDGESSNSFDAGGTTFNLTDVLIYSNNPANGGVNLSPTGNWTDVVALRGCLSGACSGNPHWFDVQTMRTNLSVNKAFLDCEGNAGAGQGDLWQITQNPANPGTKATFTNVISPMLTGNYSIGTLINQSNSSANNDYSNLSVAVTHSVIASSNNGSGGGWPLWVENNSNVATHLFANNYSAFQDNIVFSRDNLGGIVWLTAAVTPTVDDGAYVGVDYNGLSGLVAAHYVGTGSNPGSPVAAKYASPTPPGPHDVTGAPAFYQERRFLDFCAIRNPALTTFDLCIADLEAGFLTNFNVADIYNWVSAGYWPTNPAYSTAAHDGTALGLSGLSAPAAPNVTSQFTVTGGAITYSRTTQKYSQQVTLTNNGAGLSSVALALDNLAAGVTVVSPSGTTSATSPAGSPYVEVGPMSSGSTAKIVIQFTRVGTVAITCTTRVLGPGPR